MSILILFYANRVQFFSDFYCAQPGISYERRLYPLFTVFTSSRIFWPVRSEDYRTYYYQIRFYCKKLSECFGAKDWNLFDSSEVLLFLFFFSISAKCNYRYEIHVIFIYTLAVRYLREKALRL